MSAAGLDVRGLEVPFGDSPGLRGVSLSVARGERVAVVGASGAGKTTLLRAVAGLVPTRTGTIEIEGRDVTSLPPERRGAAYLHQTPVLFPHLTVAENVAFALRLRGRPEGEIRARVERLLGAVGLEDFGPRAPRTLSGGQRSRIALARAVAAEPAVLLLDEPLSALDPTLRQEVRIALLGLQKESSPALMLVTHDLDEAAAIADRLAVLLDGSIAQIGPPAELFRRPASLAVARFLGMQNELPGRLRGDGCFECVLGVFPVSSGTRTGGSVEAVAVVHPEAILLSSSGESNGRVIEIRHRVHSRTAVVDLAGAVLEARAPAADDVRSGEPVCIRIDPEQLSVFPL